jgi:hypothetical protein
VSSKPKQLKFAKGTEQESSIEFHQGMVDRMGVSFFKYGPVAAAYPDKVDAIASLKRRLERYEEDGNTEWLMDIGNFAMIEFMHPKHPKAHFRPTDTDESPGRAWNNGSESDAGNTLSHSNVKRGGSHMRTDGGFYRREGD